MANSVRSEFDLSGWTDVFDRLESQAMQESLARRMAAAGGRVLRDEAKTLAPVGTEEGGSVAPGTLKDSIYLAFRDKLSTDKYFAYSVTWNAKKAPHGHLIEFGHLMLYTYSTDGYGNYWSNPMVPLKQAIWVSAHPFLRPAFDAALPRAREAMISTGRAELPKLLRGE